MTWPTLTNVRLRTLSNTTGGDPATAQRQLEWNRAAADSVWRPLEVIGGGALAFGAQGAITSTGTTAPTVAYPTGITSGQLLVMFVGNRPNASTVATPAGWTLPTNGTATGGAGAEAAGTGVVRGTVFLREADGTETGNVTLAITGGLSVGAVILRYTKTTGKVWNVAVVNGARNTANASYTATAGSNPGVAAGDIVLVGTVTSEDTPTMSVELVAQTGLTFGAMVERVDQAVTTGNDQHLTVSEHPVSAGTGSAAPVFTMTATGTNAANTAGISLFVRLRQVDAPIILAPSAHIAASGATATTAQLTAPAGKTTSNFVAGDLSDDTNPLPTLDLATDQYTEDEWCLQATATSVNTEVYQFRVTLAGTALNTYSQTPTWTIGAVVAAGGLLQQMLQHGLYAGDVVGVG